MSKLSLMVVPVDGGWAVRHPAKPEMHFDDAADAERHARELARASFLEGLPAQVALHNRRGARIGRWVYGQGAA